MTSGWSGTINLDAATNRAQFVAGVIESKDERTPDTDEPSEHWRALAVFSVGGPTQTSCDPASIQSYETLCVTKVRHRGSFYSVATRGAFFTILSDCPSSLSLSHLRIVCINLQILREPIGDVTCKDVI